VSQRRATALARRRGARTQSAKVRKRDFFRMMNDLKRRDLKRERFTVTTVLVVIGGSEEGVVEGRKVLKYGGGRFV
jgi:hypothetical protein